MSSPDRERTRRYWSCTPWPPFSARAERESSPEPLRLARREHPGQIHHWTRERRDLLSGPGPEGDERREKERGQGPSGHGNFTLGAWAASAAVAVNWAFTALW